MVREHLGAMALLMRHLSERVYVLTSMELKYYKRVTLIVKETAYPFTPLASALSLILALILTLYLTLTLALVLSFSPFFIAVSFRWKNLSC